MHTKFHNNQYHSPCVSISSTDKELLKWIKETTGMGRIINKKIIMRKDIKIHILKDSYTYRVIYDDALHLLKDIEPYLVINRKKLRFKLILKKYKQLTPRNRKYTNEQKMQK